MAINIIIAVILVIAFGLYTWSKIRSSKVKSKESNSNPYLGLREQIFSLTANELNINTPDEKEMAFGVVLEISTGGGVATITSLATGDASMYTSTGGGMIGGIAHQNVKDAAVAFVANAQDYLGKMPVAHNIAPPKSGNIKIFILTNKHQYSIEAAEAEITTENSTWAKLFYAGNNVITQLRLAK